METDTHHAGNVLLIQVASIVLVFALILAWCIVGKNFGIPLFNAIFAGKVIRIIQAHIDFLLMAALLFGIYSTKVPLPWHVQWSFGFGAIGNPLLFLLEALIPAFDPTTPVDGADIRLLMVFMVVSISLTTYGVGMSALLILRSTFTSRRSSSFE